MKLYSRNTAMAMAWMAIPCIAAAQQINQKKVDSLVAVISKQPDNIAAIDEFNTSLGRDTTIRLSHYKTWMKKYPKSAGIYYGIGTLYTHQESPAARPYLLKAVSINPKLSAAYAELAIDAERWGEFDQSAEFQRKAYETSPDSPDYLFSYMYNFETKDPAKYEALLKELRTKFPESDRGAQALYWKALRTVNRDQKLAIYEDMRQHYPIGKSSWGTYGMNDYFDALLADDPGKAAVLAGELAATPGIEASTKEEFIKNKLMAEQLMKVDELLKAGNTEAATTLLKDVKAKRWGVTISIVALAKARVAAAVSPQQGYDTLMKYYLKEPARAMKEPLYSYGRQAGKTNEAIENDIKSRLLNSSKPAIFSFDAYMEPGKKTMQSYKGKVVLLTFWFPGCGPCRGEFPHFEEVLKHFDRNNVNYVGVNIMAEQDEYVIPFVKSSKYTFTPLKDKEANRTNLPVRGAPSNFLIDQEGRIIFSGFMIQTPEAQLMLQDMINLLLDKKA
ncbi:TlpA disulfide reductase family protein [Chitinophaga eiseniae]|uniref:Redoxin domain-containing protein n=1 Tax=Chitinophaga eiseniae TaxID=634771 RepID=A0A847SIV5_9BACT|nr:TlpA disulfide reductase family protein [Chitinophaga eiseniae]NLR79683.1 redoxin domain-containing protein [Chitinophaga eiseniae]